MPDNNQPENVNNQTIVNTSLADRHLAYAFATGNPDSVKEALKRGSKLTTTLLTSLINTGKQAFLAKIIKLKLIPIEEARALNLIDLIESADTDMTDILIELIKANLISFEEILSLAIRKNDKDIFISAIKATPANQKLDILDWAIQIVENNDFLYMINIDSPEHLDHAGIVAATIQAGAQPTPNTLRLACGTYNLDIVSMVVDLGVETPEDALNWAIDYQEEDEEDIVTEIIRAGAKPNDKTLDLLLKKSNKNIINKVLELLPPCTKDTIDYAVLTNDSDIVAKVIALGATYTPDTWTLTKAMGNGKIKELISNHIVTKNNKMAVSIGTEAEIFTTTAISFQELLLLAIEKNDEDFFIKVLRENPTEANLETAIRIIIDDHFLARLDLPILVARAIAIELLNIIHNEGQEALFIKILKSSSSSAKNISILIEKINLDAVDILMLIDIFIELIKAKLLSFKTLLSLAIRKNNTDIFVNVIKANPREDILDWAIYAAKDTCFVDMITAKNQNIIDIAVQAGARPTEKTLAAAVFTTNPAIVKTVVELGALPSKGLLNWAMITCEELENSIEDSIIADLVRAGAQADGDTLEHAYKYGNLTTIKKIFELNPPFIKDILHYAILKGFETVMKVIGLGYLPNQDTLDFAIKTRCEERILDALIEAGAKPTVNTLSLALSLGNRIVIEKVIALSPPITQEALGAMFSKFSRRDSNAIIKKVIEKLDESLVQRALYLAIWYGYDKSIISLLIQLIPQYVNNELLGAVLGNDSDTVAKVIASGAAPIPYILDLAILYDCNESIITALIEAKAQPTAKTLEFLLQKGKKNCIIKVMDLNPSITPLTLDQAVLTHDGEIVAKVIKLGIILPNDILSWAISISASEDVVNALIEADAKPDEETLDLALQKGNKNIIAKIIELNPPFTEATLDLAVETEDSDIVKGVIALGAPLSESTYSLAKDSNNQEIKALIKSLIANNTKTPQTSILKREGVFSSTQQPLEVQLPSKHEHTTNPSHNIKR